MPAKQPASVGRDMAVNETYLPPGFDPKFPFSRDRWHATVRIRRGDNFPEVRPEAEGLDGKRILVSYSGPCSKGDNRYPGEISWFIEEPRSNGIGWLATGDLVDWEPEMSAYRNGDK